MRRRVLAARPGLCELRLALLPPCLCLSIIVSPFYLTHSLCVPPLSRSSSPKYRIMTQFSWAVRASREMVTIATAPVLLCWPTVAGALSALHCPSRGSKIHLGCVRVDGWGKADATISLLQFP